MDGFHLSNEVLGQLGERHRKGAIHTFDAQGFVALVEHLATTSDTTPIPLFDRDQDAVISDAATIESAQRILVVEGNYLLVDEHPWRRLRQFFKKSIFLNPGMAVLKARLIQRWLDQGYDDHGARERALGNDIPNAELGVTRSRLDDVVVVDSLKAE